MYTPAKLGKRGTYESLAIVVVEKLAVDHIHKVVGKVEVPAIIQKKKKNKKHSKTRQNKT